MDKTSLIYKVLSGQATESEKTELNEWIASNPTNKEDFEDIKFVVEDVKNIDEQIDRNDPFYDGLRKIESMIEISKRKDRKIKLYRSISLVLSLIVLSLTVAVYIFDWRPYSKIQVTSPIRDNTGERSNKILLDNLKFDDVTLGGIINTLEKKYGLVFEVSTAELLSCRFTGTFYHDISIEDIIRTLAESIGFNYSILNAQKYELHGKGCKV